MSPKRPDSSAFETLRAAAGVQKKQNRGAYGVATAEAERSRREASVRRVSTATIIGIVLLLAGGAGAWWYWAPSSPRQTVPTEPKAVAESSGEESTAETETTDAPGEESEAIEADVQATLPPVELERPSVRESLTSFVVDWTEAWTERDPEVILGFYSASFAGDGHEAWATKLRQRIEQTQWIRVSVVGLELSANDSGGVEATFTETRRDPSRERTSEKRLTLVPDGKGWKIADEQTL